MTSSSAITTAASVKASWGIPASLCCGTAPRSSASSLASAFSSSPPPPSFCSPPPASFAAVARYSTSLRPRPTAEAMASLAVSKMYLT